MNKREAGRFGGIITFLRYGSEGMAERGKRGGRPRVLTLDRQHQALGAQENEKEVKGIPSNLPDSLIELRRLYLHRRSSGDTQNKAMAAGIY